MMRTRRCVRPKLESLEFGPQLRMKTQGLNQSSASSPGLADFGAGHLRCRVFFGAASAPCLVPLLALAALVPPWVLPVLAALVPFWRLRIWYLRCCYVCWLLWGLLWRMRLCYLQLC